jgi:acyl dehydratase
MTGSGAAVSRETVELADIPGLSGAYGRGAARSGQIAVRRRLSATGRSVSADALPAVDYTVRDVRVDAAHLTAYQHLLGEPATDALPAGFVHVVAFPVAVALMGRPDFPFPLVGMVHVANRVEQRGQLVHGDALEIWARAENLRPHRSGVQFDLVVEVWREGPPGQAPGPSGRSDPDRPPLWRGVSTYLARGFHLGPDGVTETRAPAPARPPGLPTAIWRLAADTGRRYAAVSGDRNPIHMYALTARPFGFPRAIAHGMYTASRALATIGPSRTDSFTWTVEFAKPVLLPGRVTLQVARADTGHTSDTALVSGGFTYAGWNSTSGAVHFTGTVIPAAGS